MSIDDAGQAIDRRAVMGVRERCRDRVDGDRESAVETAAIGRRYRRQDEIGTPWCVTIDFDTIEKPGDTFTLRERDSMAQKRITEAELFALLEEQVY